MRSHGRLYYALQPRWARFWSRHVARALFVHINKTAGSSVEAALGMPFQHRTALEFIDLVGRERWDRCFTFSFVRNPWAKVASHYRYRVRTNQTALKEQPIPFSEWVARAYGEQDPKYCDQPKMFMSQSAWICDRDGEILVDFVGRFEHLRRDFDHVCRALGKHRELPHLKGSSRGTSYAEMYDDQARAIVAERFAEDLERWGYTFDPQPSPGTAPSLSLIHI